MAAKAKAGTRPSGRVGPAGPEGPEGPEGPGGPEGPSGGSAPPRPRSGRSVPASGDGPKPPSPVRSGPDRSGPKRPSQDKPRQDRPIPERPSREPPGHGPARPDGPDRAPDRFFFQAQRDCETITGIHPVRAALLNPWRRCLRLEVSKTRTLVGVFGETVNLAREMGVEVEFVEPRYLSLFSERGRALSLLATEPPPVPLEDLLEAVGSSGPALVLALDHVQDPHNLGALIRSAAAFGAAGVVIPKDRSAPMSDVVRFASAGASESLNPVRVANLTRALGALKKAGFWVAAADEAAGTPLDEFDFPERCVLLLGAEGRGLSRITARAADLFVRVDMSPDSPVESLNVSNAGAILMHSWAASARARRAGRGS